MSDNVLIVDDSLTVRMDLTEAFEEAGFRVLPCGTVAEALEVLARTEVAVAVLDVLLPDGNGMDLLQEVRASASSSRAAVLMLSSEAEVKDRVHALSRGADEYVGKPYDTSYVIAKARELLRAQSGSHTPKRAPVLIIDDSLTFRSELSAILETAGYRVIAASSGEEGLRKAAEERPCAVVVDGVLPGIDGATVIRRMRLDAALRSVPCLLLTASEDREAELTALDAGADAFVRKADQVEDLILAKLAAVLRGAAAPTRNSLSVLGTHKVLCVDDSSTYLNALGDCLREDGYEVTLAHSGEEALELLAVQGVDCILLDLIMPGLGGKETCRRIKAAPVVRDTPLILLTSVEDRVTMLEGLADGADDFIPKSSELDVVRARVRAQIRRKQFEDENRRIRDQLLQQKLEAAEARAARDLAETRAELIAELERKNRELEAFSYSVSHDLRAPLRSIDGFSQALLEDQLERLDARGQRHLHLVRKSAQRMGELIDDLLELSRVGRGELLRTPNDLSALARDVAAELYRREPEREVELVIAGGLHADVDARLLRIVFENLLGNAWKFTRKVQRARIEVGQLPPLEGSAFFVRDNGAGFAMSYADRLFRPFQRLHTEEEFPGTGIGLATIQRIVDRHGGRAWAAGEVGLGATFFFTLSQRFAPRAEAPLEHRLGQ
ncbi:MAG: response regulator [Deltaproteobacteria bacterium]